MKGVSMTRITYRPYAYCLGTDPGIPPDCTFERRASTTLTVAALRADVQRHVKDTGHTVLVDVVDRTAYRAEAAPAVTP